MTGAPEAKAPWSDLYSLGCVAWELVTGAPLFAGRSPRELQRQHAAAPVPPLIPRTAVPENLERWLRRLLAKAPEERYRFAADALRGLASLGEPQPAPVSQPITWEASGPLDLADAAHELTPLPEVPVEVPPHWPPAPSTPVPQGAGLGLVGLRTLPLVGRTQAAQELWSQLAAVWQTRRPSVVVLRGPVGQGKTHLARSVAWRAHERLGVELWTAEHSPFFDPSQGLRRTLASALGCVGLGPEEGHLEIARFLVQHQVEEPYERAALAEFLYGGPSMSMEAQHALILRVLGWLCRHRPLVLRLEDLQWGPTTVAFVQALVSSSADLPVLVIATVDEPAPDIDLPWQAHATELTVDPLTDADQHAVISAVLPLAPDLARRVVSRTQGSPLFAEGLVGDWVQRGVLTATPQGFTLQSGASEELPDSLHAVWMRVIEGILASHPEVVRPALHIGCCLGLEVDGGEWSRACVRYGLGEVAVDALMDALYEADLGHPTRSGASLRFTHPLVWESLRRDAEEAGTWPEAHRACAEMLVEAGLAELAPDRVGLHWFFAGAHEASLEPLREGARRSLRVGELPRARMLLDHHDEAMGALGRPPSDARWGEGGLVRADVLIAQGASGEARSVVADLAERARTHQWRSILPEALGTLGLCLLKLGQLLESEAMFALAQSTASMLDGNPAARTVARCAMYRGTLLRIRGSLEEALDTLAVSQQRFRDLEDPMGLADCASERGHALLTLAGDLEGAEAAVREAMAGYDAAGHQIGLATCVNTLGDILRRRGDLAGAEEAYQRARLQFDRLGADSRLFPRMNLGLVWLARGQVADADGVFAEAQALIERGGRAALQPVIQVCRLPGAAYRKDWEAWDGLLRQLGSLPASEDLAWILDQAGALASAADQPARARVAWERAAGLYEALGREHEASSLRSRVSDEGV